LKEYYEGEILAIMGRDLVTKCFLCLMLSLRERTRKYWSWFLELLIVDLKVLHFVPHTHLCMTNKRYVFHFGH